MPKLDKETKEQIKRLDYKDLQDIVISLASKEKTAYDYILLNYLDKESGEQDLFEATKADLEFIFRKRHKGFSEELQIANMLGTCIKRINEFTKISKNKVLEAELLLFILQIPFSLTTKMFGTCFTKYDTKVAMIVKRLITIVTTKLHNDYKVEYEDIINEYLLVLHKTSTHIGTVYNLPKAI
jgi:hypothetical protein